MDRVSEEERGKSQSSEMRGTGKGEQGFFYEGKGEEETKCDGFDEWVVVMYECMHWSVEELASNKTGGVQEKVRSPK